MRGGMKVETRLLGLPENVMTKNEAAVSSSFFSILFLSASAFTGLSLSRNHFECAR